MLASIAAMDDGTTASDDSALHSNGHSNEDAATQQLLDAEFYAESFVQNGILISGIIFNIINLIILPKISLGENYRVCLIALTISDLLACIFGVIQLTIEGIYFRNVMPFGYWNTIAYVDYLLYYVYIYFMCMGSAIVILTAIVRTYTLRHPIKAIAAFTPIFLKKTCVIMFLVTFILFFPTPLWGVWQTCFNEPEQPKCKEFFERFPHVEKLRYYFYSLSIIFGPIVLVVNIVCLVAVKKSLNKNTHTASERFNRRPKSIYKMARRHSKITRTLVLILLLDSIWILPTCVQYVGLVFSPKETLFNSKNLAFTIYDLVAEILLNIRPIYNIFVFLVTNKDFRNKFKLLFCHCCVKDISPPSSYLGVTEERRKMSNGAVSGNITNLTNSHTDRLSPDIGRNQKQLSWKSDNQTTSERCRLSSISSHHGINNGISDLCVSIESINVDN